MKGLGFRVSGLGFRVEGLGFGVCEFDAMDEVYAVDAAVVGCMV